MSDQVRRAAQANAAAAVLATLFSTKTNDGNGAETTDGKPRSVVDVVDQSQKSFAKLLSDTGKKDADAPKNASSTAKSDGSSSDSKRVANTYAAYASFNSDDAQAKAA